MNKYIEQVPVKWISEFKEFDRFGKDRYRSDNELEGLKKAISEFGIVSPIYIDVNPFNKTCKIGEGNHRVAIAEMVGIETVPTYVLINRSGTSTYNHDCSDVIKSIDKIKQAGVGEPYNVGKPYLPYEMKPSDVFNIKADNVSANIVVADKGTEIVDKQIAEMNTDEKDTVDYWKEMALYDNLTSLPNRNAYELVIEQIGNEFGWLGVVDIDHFKKVNDTYGHDMGDLFG